MLKWLIVAKLFCYFFRLICKFDLVHRDDWCMLYTCYKGRESTNIVSRKTRIGARLIQSVSSKVLSPGTDTDRTLNLIHGHLTRCVKLWVAHAPGVPGTFSCHRLQRKQLVGDSGMCVGTCMTNVPWCMSGLLTRCGGENVPGACATRNFMYLARSSCAAVSYAKYVNWGA